MSQTRGSQSITNIVAPLEVIKILSIKSVSSSAELKFTESLKHEQRINSIVIIIDLFDSGKKLFVRNLKKYESIRDCAPPKICKKKKKRVPEFENILPSKIFGAPWITKGYGLIGIIGGSIKKNVCHPEFSF